MRPTDSHKGRYANRSRYANDSSALENVALGIVVWLVLIGAAFLIGVYQ